MRHKSSLDSMLAIVEGVMPLAASPVTTELFIPINDRTALNPEVSIVVPALNENITIGEFVDWCWEGLEKEGIDGEVIIVDSSSDDTPQIALNRGARVLRTPKKGLGQAYIDSIPYIRSNFIIMGDCDLTYDFRELRHFVKSYRSGGEFVMGSRFLGSIEDGAMPKLHRYFGTPLTTWMLNKIYSCRFSDIHCGMRGLTKSALLKIDLTSAGWEYASEMVLKAARLNLKISEVPVLFYKDRDGRQSHLKRGGFWTPWKAGWINLRVMLVFSPDSFLIMPGLFFTMIGVVISILSLPGYMVMGPFRLSIYSQMLGLVLVVLGYALFQAGILGRIKHGLNQGVDKFILNKLSYDKGMFFSLVLIGSGFLLDLNFFIAYLRNGLIVVSLSTSAIFGLLLLAVGVQTFSFTLLLELERRLTKLISS